MKKLQNLFISAKAKLSIKKIYKTIKPDQSFIV